jgi:hypothetical protein
MPNIYTATGDGDFAKPQPRIFLQSYHKIDKVAMPIEFPLKKCEQRRVGVQLLDDVVVGVTTRERLGTAARINQIEYTPRLFFPAWPAFAQPTSHVSIVCILAQSLWTITLHIEYDAKLPD